MDKYCTQCGKKKPEEQFSWLIKAQKKRFSECKECFARRRRAHYLRNREKNKEQTRRYKQATYEKFREYKKTCKCEVCGEDDPQCLDFHHKDRSKERKRGSLGQKLTILSLANNGWSWEKVLADIKDCKVLCCNCHLKEHGWKTEHSKEYINSRGKMES